MLQIVTTPILAGIADLLGPFIGLIMLVMWVVRQIVEANKQAGPPKGQPQAAAAKPPQVQPPPKGGVQPAQAGQQADPLRSQVEEFLRRAGRGQQQAGKPVAGDGRPMAGGPRDIEVLIDDGPEPVERGRLAESLRPLSQPAAPTSAQPAAAPRKARTPRRPGVARRETVAEHVAENVAAHSRAVGEQASRLGQSIIQDDQQFDQQLKAKFDHTVGTLTGSDVAAAELALNAANEANRPAAQIAALLARPEGVQQAIIINEILRPPTDRW